LVVLAIFAALLPYRSLNPRIKGSVTFFDHHTMTDRQSFKPMITAAANQSRDASVRTNRATGRRLHWFATATVASLLAACNSATDANHPLRGAASTVGWATTTGEPKDFVRARRAGAALAYVPVGRGGIERPVAFRNPDAVRGLEGELDQQRDRSERTARRALPAGAYNRPLPSVAAPPQPRRAGLPERPTAGAPESYPVSPNRLRQLRDNARQATP
jgi:hypothetical protein